MNTSRYILFFAFFFITFFAAAQDGRRIYVLSTGDTTLVVNKISGGLRDKESQFLFRRSASNALPKDSVFPNMEVNYKSLEEASYDVNRLLNKVMVEQNKIMQEGNEGLGFRLSQINRRNMRNEAKARNAYDSIMSQDHSVEDLMALYARFGNKPTYYINGVEVEEEMVNLLEMRDIIKRTFKTTDTASGNPNGEIWLDVSDRGVNRIRNRGVNVPASNEPSPSMIFPAVQTSTARAKGKSEKTNDKKKNKKENKGSKMEEVEIKREGMPSVKTFRPAK